MNYIMLGLFLLAIVVSNATVAEGQTSVTLTRSGKPSSTIVLAAKPTRAAQFAAFEIQHHINLISGTTVPIVTEGSGIKGQGIYIGDTNAARKAGLSAAGFKSQEYAVKFVADGIILAGKDAKNYETVTYDAAKSAYSGLPGYWEEQGTLHAAYDFLEQFCGVRWLNQTDFGMKIPKSGTLKVKPRNIRRVPSFQYRDALAAIGDSIMQYDAYTTFWPDNSLEFKAWQQSAYADMGTRGAQANLYVLRMRNGGKMQRCNHSLYGYYARFWANPETRRPELFAKGYEGEPPQLCFTSRELIKQVAEDARKYYDTGDNQGIFWNPRPPNWFPVEPMDNGSFCKCDNCQALLTEDEKDNKDFSNGMHSDYFFNFVNEVAKELRKTHPNRSVVTLAYMSHAKPPSKIKLDPSVAVQFCFATNRGAIYSKSYDREIELLKQWTTDGSGRPMYLWLYDTFPLESARNANLHCWPGAFAHTIGEQMRLFKKLGVLGMFHCGYGQDVEAYVTFKLMNDSSYSVDSLLNDYFNGIYGAAAKPMKTFYLETEKSYKGKVPQYTEQRMAQLAELVRKADSLAKTDAEKRNLEQFKLNTWAYMQEGMKQRQLINQSPVPSVTVPRVSDAGGDGAKVSWDKAITLPGTWYQNNSHLPALRKVSGRVAHDGKYLYLELVDQCDTASLKSSAMVFPFDDWEVFVASQQGLPYRQYAINPDGLVVGLSHGEVSFRMNVPMDQVPLTVVSDKSAADRWITRLVWPLDKIVPEGVKPGGKFFMNILRVWKLPSQGVPVGAGIETWGPFTKVHDMSRAPGLTLE
jgi:hypothetical protein